VDGQRHCIGDVQVPFTLQSSGKPLNYALALNELGEDFVHKLVKVVIAWDDELNAHYSVNYIIIMCIGPRLKDVYYVHSAFRT